MGTDTIEARFEDGGCIATDEASKAWLQEPDGIPGMTWWSILLTVMAITGIALAMLRKYAHPGKENGR